MNDLKTNDFESCLSNLTKLFGKPKFQQYVFVDVENEAVEMVLEDTEYYAEWIEGEGADIALFKAYDDNRVIGVRLPLRKWSGNLSVEIFNHTEKFHTDNGTP
jgi:hypothetical protein